MNMEIITTGEEYKKLMGVSIPVRRKTVVVDGRVQRFEKPKELLLSAYTVTDEEFLNWIEREIRGIGLSNRLNYRLTILGILDQLKAQKKDGY